VLLIGVWIFGILLRLLQLQVIEHSRLRAQVADQNRTRIDIVPPRGAIYDRNGKILAQSIPAQSVFYTPSLEEPLEARMKAVEKVESLLALGPRDKERIESGLRKDSRFIWIKRKTDPESARLVKDLGLNGIFSQEEKMRFYPQGRLAAHILGGVDIDNKGLSGVELRYDSVLRGKKGGQVILRDAHKREYHFETVVEPQSGRDIVLTIDETIQYIAQSELEKSAQEHLAAWATVIVGHPASGEILAMANWPTFDPNAYPPESKEAEINRGIHHLFEPGSMFKIVTASAALENGRVSMSEIFDCSKGLIAAAGSPIRDHKNFGVLTFPGIIIHSSNVGTILVGRRIGQDSLYETIKAFRFGEKTGVDLPAEASGIIRPPAKWSHRSLDALSIGYEVSATALQILQAMNAIANRGIPVPPRIVKAVRGSISGKSHNAPEFRQVISELSARRLIPILEKVVLEGTGQAALAKGYTMAGKTGTTQIFDPALKSYSSSKHIASFVGFVPVENPVLSIVVVLSEPKKDVYYGGQVAAPVFREIASRVLRYLRVYPQRSPGQAIVAANLLKDGE
jgi:cell division protein FtsI (penicillin-binding protein 3)